MMKVRNLLVTAMVIMVTSPLAAYKFESQSPIDVPVALGGTIEDPTLAPETVSLEALKSYRLVINNPTSDTHFISLSDLYPPRVMWTQSMRLDDAVFNNQTGRIEISPGGSVVWYLLPVRMGEYILGHSVDHDAQVNDVSVHVR